MRHNEPSPHASGHYAELPYGLTPTELYIVHQLSLHGETQTQLALRLHYTRSGINHHLWNIYRKMGVHHAAAAAVKWIREQEIPSLPTPPSQAQ